MAERDKGGKGRCLSSGRGEGQSRKNIDQRNHGIKNARSGLEKPMLTVWGDRKQNGPEGREFIRWKEARVKSGSENGLVSTNQHAASTERVRG